MPTPHRSPHCNPTCILRLSLSLCYKPRQISTTPLFNSPTQFDPSLSLLPVLSQCFLSNLVSTFSLQLCCSFSILFPHSSHLLVCRDWPLFELCTVWPFASSVCLCPPPLSAFQNHPLILCHFVANSVSDNTCF